MYFIFKNKLGSIVGATGLIIAIYKIARKCDKEEKEEEKKKINYETIPTTVQILREFSKINDSVMEKKKKKKFKSEGDIRKHIPKSIYKKREKTLSPRVKFKL